MIKRFIRDFKTNPLKIILLTGDKDFTNDIHEAKNEDGVSIEIMLVHPQVSSEVLKSFAHLTMHFDFLVRDIHVEVDQYLKVTNLPSTQEERGSMSRYFFVHKRFF